VLTALAQRACVTLASRITAELRKRIVSRILALDTSIVHGAGSGDVTSRVTEDMEIFSDAVPLIAEVFAAAATVAVSLAAFGSLDWRLALAFAVVVPVYLLSLRTYLPRAGARYAAERRAAAERSQTLLESLHGAATIEAYDMAALQTARITEDSERAADASISALKLSLWLIKSLNAAEALGLSAILLTGSYLVHDREISVGAVAAAALLFHRLFEPLGTLVGSFDDVQRAGAPLARIVGVARMPLVEPAPTRKPSGGVALEVRGVRHSYADGVEVVRGVDLTVPAGTSMAVVGTSGAGKSTLAAIIAGLLPASVGDTVLHDAHGTIDAASLDDENRASWIGMIAQDTHVFTGTLRDDMTLATPDADDRQISAALEAVGAGWAVTLPDGLDTLVGSGGLRLDPAQAQQLALARITLADPPIVVLDEASAEAGSARELDLAATALARGRTAIVIAHRLFQARACDQILVMDDGRITEHGTHDELLARGGGYAALWGAWTVRANVAPDWAPNAFFPFKTLLDRGRVIRATAVSVDPSGVTLDSGERVEADYLVLATGSGYTYPAKPNPASTDIAKQLDDLRETHKELAGADRVLILGAGPVGLELAGEIKEVWPDKHVVIIERADQVLPGFLPEVRDDLRRQLDKLGIELRLSTGLAAQPPAAPGLAGPLTVTTDKGDEIVADIWFRAFGVRINTDYLTDGRLTPLTGQATIPVTERLNVQGYEHVYAIGDIADLSDPKMASYAMTHAEVVAKNIKAQIAGNQPTTIHTPTPERRILLPLGKNAGVGQLPTPDGVTAATPETVHQRKGADLFTARFAARFGRD
jgi:ATP-binding cassette subfamily C protein